MMKEERKEGKCQEGRKEARRMNEGREVDDRRKERRWKMK